jgi:pilus assembly protein FimV
MDLGGISLDLDMPQISDPSGPGTASTPFDLSQDDDADPLARKIELAEEFRQIGDLEGARDLLQEVIERADGALKSRAQAMLDNLS